MNAVASICKLQDYIIEQKVIFLVNPQRSFQTIWYVSWVLKKVVFTKTLVKVLASSE